MLSAACVLMPFGVADLFKPLADTLREATGAELDIIVRQKGNEQKQVGRTTKSDATSTHTARVAPAVASGGVPTRRGGIWVLLVPEWLSVPCVCVYMGPAVLSPPGLVRLLGTLLFGLTCKSHISYDSHAAHISLMAHMQLTYLA